MTRLPKIAAALTMLLGALLLPAFASAEYLVPEGNSAVNQYTESIPGAGGEVGTNSGKAPAAKPADTIGAGNAKKLSKAGPDGQAAAELAIETAPEAAPAPAPAEADGKGAGHPANGKKSHKHAKKSHHGKAKPKPKSGESPQHQGAAAPASGGEGPGGSSGANSLFSAATGTEDGHLGLLLPIAVLAAVAWGAGYALRQRQRQRTALR
jgi:hypothetical protein